MRKIPPKGKELEDIPGRGWSMSKAERHERAGYFWRTVIRLERLEDRIKENGVEGERGGKLIWRKRKKLECHVKNFYHNLIVMGC